MIAALLTRMSSRPCSAHPVEQRLGLLVVGVVDGDGDAFAACRGHQLGGLVDRACERRLAGLRRAPGDVDGAAVAAERVRDAEARRRGWPR